MLQLFVLFQRGIQLLTHCYQLSHPLSARIHCFLVRMFFALESLFNSSELKQLINVLLAHGVQLVLQIGEQCSLQRLQQALIALEQQVLRDARQHHLQDIIRELGGSFELICLGLRFELVRGVVQHLPVDGARAVELVQTLVATLLGLTIDELVVVVARVVGEVGIVLHVLELRALLLLVLAQHQSLSHLHESTQDEHGALEQLIDQRLQQLTRLMLRVVCSHPDEIGRVVHLVGAHGGRNVVARGTRQLYTVAHRLMVALL